MRPGLNSQGRAKASVLKFLSQGSSHYAYSLCMFWPIKSANLAVPHMLPKWYRYIYNNLTKTCKAANKIQIQFVYGKCRKLNWETYVSRLSYIF